MGIYGVAPLRKGMYRTVPPNVSGGMGGNTDIKQFTKGSKLYYPVYVNGAKFSVGDGHMAQGDGEVCVTAIETLMAVTCRFKVIKNTIIESPQAIVPSANPTDQGLTPEMLAKARRNTATYRKNSGFDNVEFRLGEIEYLPLADASVDVVISNGVLNLVPEKERALSEILRVLRRGGRLQLADIAIDTKLSEEVRRNTDLWAA